MFKERNTCRCCGNNNLYKYLDLGKQPLANDYLPFGAMSDSVPYFPLEVNLCRNCYHSQLSVVVNPPKMFRHYLYVSGTTKTFNNHCKALAEDAVNRFDGQKIQVLDIACNDGTLLEKFKDLNCDVMGVDPAENLREISKGKGIHVLVNYWSVDLWYQIPHKMDIITGTNVFAHVDDVEGFLDACHLILKDKGITILEFPYCDEMIKNVEFDTIYHEHVSYFLVNSFKTLVNRKGFYIYDIIQTPIHGGSIRFLLKKGNQEDCDKAHILIKDEEEKGLLMESTYTKFSESVDKNKEDLTVKLKELKEKGYKVIGYGASAKGNTMLNYFKEVYLDYIVDDNEMKWNHSTPGRLIAINSPQVMKDEEQNLAIVILSWNFFEEIKKKIKDIRGDKEDIYVLYVPEVT